MRGLNARGGGRAPGWCMPPPPAATTCSAAAQAGRSATSSCSSGGKAVGTAQLQACRRSADRHAMLASGQRAAAHRCQQVAVLHPGLGRAGGQQGGSRLWLPTAAGAAAALTVQAHISPAPPPGAHLAIHRVDGLHQRQRVRAVPALPHIVQHQRATAGVACSTAWAGRKAAGQGRVARSVAGTAQDSWTSSPTAHLPQSSAPCRLPGGQALTDKTAPHPGRGRRWRCRRPPRRAAQPPPLECCCWVGAAGRDPGGSPRWPAVAARPDPAAWRRRGARPLQTVRTPGRPARLAG